MSSEMEVEKSPAAPQVVSEVVEEAATKVVQKEESVVETVVTAVTATAVDASDEKADVEEKAPEVTDKMKEEGGELEKEIVEMEGEEEEEEGRAKQLTGLWESEVRPSRVRQNLHPSTNTTLRCQSEGILLLALLFIVCLFVYSSGPVGSLRFQIRLLTEDAVCSPAM